MKRNMNNLRASPQTLIKESGKSLRNQVGELRSEIVKLREENQNLREGYIKQNFITNYMEGARKVIDQLSQEEIQKTVDSLSAVKKRGGRLFLLGVGGSAANCSHAVNDFRKICHIETYTVVDNVAELTARINDEGWDTAFVEWLKGSHLDKKDAIMVLSVGGGNIEKNVSTNIVRAIEYAKEVGSMVLGIVSRDGGYTRKVADACVLVPVISNDMITPYAESFQALIWHLMVNHPDLLI
jgi:D-sedoheptulose 7-phosphate isomerase